MHMHTHAHIHTHTYTHTYTLILFLTLANSVSIRRRKSHIIPSSISCSIVLSVYNRMARFTGEIMVT